MKKLRATALRHRLITGFAAMTLAAGAFSTPLSTQAQTPPVFPDHPLRMVVPFPAGGPTDIVARPLAQMLGDVLGQPVVVDNRGGAGGSIGADVVAKAPADGYTLFIGTVGTHAINSSLYKKLSYDAVKDFTPLGLVAMAPVALVVHASAPYPSVAELIATAKQQPDRLYYGSAGNGTPGHLTGEMFAKATGVTLEHVPYKGSAPAITDLLGAQIPIMFDPVQSVLQHVKSGKLRALAVSSNTRSPVLPDVPTFREAGLEDFEATAWWAMFAPAGVPAAIGGKLQSAIRQVVDSAGFRDKLLEVGVQTAPATQQSFAEFQRAELAKWGAAVRDSGVNID